jgi:hypothetical protein
MPTIKFSIMFPYIFSQVLAYQPPITKNSTITPM